MRLPIDKVVCELINNRELRIFIAKVCLVSFLMVFSVSLPLFFLKEPEPWGAFFKAFVLSLFAFSLGMFSAITGEFLKYLEEQADEQREDN